MPSSPKDQGLPPISVSENVLSKHLRAPALFRAPARLCEGYRNEGDIVPELQDERQVFKVESGGTEAKRGHWS